MRVTVLAIFNRLKAQPDMYMNVFGESVLNDAVGLVLYKVLSAFLGGKAVTGGNVMGGIGLFIGIFVGSTVIGIAVGLLAALIFRSRYFYSGPVGLAVVFAYGSYLLADCIHFSGIVAVVVNGMVMGLYVRPNLSPEAEHKIENLFRVLASLFELFVFVYIGTTLFLQEEQFNIFDYTALCLLALALSRAANVFPLSALVNWLRPPERHIPPKQQFLMWWSGLRGAMAFALAVDAAEKYGVYGRVRRGTAGQGGTAVGGRLVLSDTSAE
ncbi:hypothetical protein GPECTOR_33g587 [Gonium pectorale]|uniref:Cation/H+ exchanger transmembrane domain-containing protein n=1 Tax=Gonium pectorale TaxID=33097 RepID=A0A150GDP0_GONPE|nr:hypothetical protein GPECTOR_33g587 [Gonium pectorale]|eukprot:KXZ47705.1 hypothetical protein GPECTOR_33g587 [Gonium pectorale]